LLVRLLNDPQTLIRSAAAHELAHLEFRPALPHLLRELRRGRAFNGELVPAIAAVGDETAVPVLIDTIPASGEERQLRAIETITGLSLEPMRQRWGLTYYHTLGAFHQAMHEWWEENRHHAPRNGRAGTAAGQSVDG
jgi:hypothetical protein